MATPKQTKTLTLDLTKIPQTKRQTAKEEVGEFVRDEILRFVSKGQSPVAGRSFDRLSQDYADKYKGGNRTPNLELEGDMLDALKYEVKGNAVEIGIFDSDEIGKADGHNNFSGDSKLPTRRFIPAETESFKPEIERGVKEILDRHREDFDPFGVEDISALALASAVLSNPDVEIEDILSGIIGGEL